MKRRSIFFFLIVLGLSAHCQSIDFDQYFYSKTLRIDLIHSGNDSSEYFALEKLRCIPFWAGSKKKLLDPFDYGNYKAQVIDAKSKKEIYSKTYGCYFFEWQTTSEAAIMERSFRETVNIPYPKDSVHLLLYRRSPKSGKWVLKLTLPIQANNYNINKESVAVYPVINIHGKGAPEKSIDIVVLPEGYTQEEMEKFRQDCEEFSKGLLSYPPFDQYATHFTINAVMAPSQESGVDIPGDSIWKNTLLDFSFSSLGIERYLMSNSVHKMHDVAANTPYDLIYILVNSDKYGGGAIYNFYSVSSMDNRLSAGVYRHEFGHLFGGLGDEYYTKLTTYGEMYNLKLEPWEPNITTLVDFEKKWKDQLSPDIPIPTPRIKKHKEKVGVFEGGGYSSKGIYSPYQNCLMKVIDAKGFCPVCKKALENMVLFYIE